MITPTTKYLIFISIHRHAQDKSMSFTRHRRFSESGAFTDEEKENGCNQTIAAD